MTLCCVKDIELSHYKKEKDMANLDKNREKSWAVVDIVYNDDVYVGSYDDCCEFIEEQGMDGFSYKIKRNYGAKNRRNI